MLAVGKLVMSVAGVCVIQLASFEEAAFQMSRRGKSRDPSPRAPPKTTRPISKLMIEAVESAAERSTGQQPSEEGRS